MQSTNHTNKVLRIEIELDPNVLKSQNIEPDGAIELLRKNFTKTGLIEKKVEGCHIIYDTDGSNKGMAHIMLIHDGLLEAQWFKDACIKWDLYVEKQKNTRVFEYEGSTMETAKERGHW